MSNGDVPQGEASIMHERHAAGLQSLPSDVIEQPEYAVPPWRCECQPAKCYLLGMKACACKHMHTVSVEVWEVPPGFVDRSRRARMHIRAECMRGTVTQCIGRLDLRLGV